MSLLVSELPFCSFESVFEVCYLILQSRVHGFARQRAMDPALVVLTVTTGQESSCTSSLYSQNSAKKWVDTTTIYTCKSRYHIRYSCMFQ